MSDHSGRKLGNWVLESLLGTGAFGAVYLAKNPVIGQEAAVKVLHPQMATKEVKRRFFAEARAASQARLSDDDPRPHPGVVQIFDGDDGSRTGDGLCYIVMERLVGTTLHEVLRRGPLPSLLTAQLGAALSDTLLAVHRREVVHRDLKPANIFLLQGDPRRPKILDFGIAKLRAAGLGTQSGTVPGTVLGTPQYMSPEQGQGLDEVDERSDLYSLGVILFQCRTRRVPFDGPNYQSILFQHLSRPVPPLPPDTPEALARLIRDLMEKDPAARPAVEQARDRLREIAAAAAANPLPAVVRAAAEDRGGSPPPETELNRIAAPGQHAGRAATPAAAVADGPVPATLPLPLVPVASADGQGAPLPADSMISFPVDETGRRPPSPWRRRAPLLPLAALPIVALLAWRPGGPRAPDPVAPPSTPPVLPSTPPVSPGAPAAAATPKVGVPTPPPPGFVPSGHIAVSRDQVTIAEFRQFVEKKSVAREGPGKWPWALSTPVPGKLAINHVSPALAQRYCGWRVSGGRLPTRAELRLAGSRLAPGAWPDLVADEPQKCPLGFRCATRLKDPE